MTRRALTGIQPSGTPHVGNWLGAIQPALALSESCEGYYFIASYHALTTSRDAALLRQRRRPLDPGGEHIDVEVVVLEVVEDRLQLGHGVGVADLLGRLFAHGSIVLVRVPSATWVA